jgi:hypothetical protein
MSKFNGFENHLLTRGLELVRAEMRAEIENTPEGRIHLMTVGYVNMICDEALTKLDSHTSKQALKDRANQ